MIKKKQYLTLIFLLLATGSRGCLVHDPAPDLGECADAGDLEVYEYGQIGIGTCLAGPTDLKIVQDPDDPDQQVLLVVNSNFEYNFAHGSLLAIPLSGIDESRETNYMHEVGAVSIPIEGFPGGVGITADGSLALVSDRQADKLLGDLTDRVYAVDLTGLWDDAPSMEFADRGQEVDDGGHSYVPVPTDPYTVVTHPVTGLAYVLDLTTHQVTVLDATGDPITVIDVVGSGDASDPVFEDLDGSGSYADFHLDAFSPTVADAETWAIRYVEGTTALYLGVGDEESPDLGQLLSPDYRNWTASAVHDLESPGPADWCEAGFGRASVSLVASDDYIGRLMWVEGRDADGTPAIGFAQTLDYWTLNWNLDDLDEPVLAASSSDVDALGVGDPWVVVDEDSYLLYYTAHGSDGRTVGLATGDGTSFGRASKPVLEPAAGAWDGEEVFGPSAYRWTLTGEDLLYYTGSDGDRLAIGLAIGAGGAGFERVDLLAGDPGLVLEPGGAGEWDEAGVAYPAVIQDAGLFHMLYAGTDGATWGLGHAVSFDGMSWIRDPANPVIEDLDAAPVVGAVKVSSGDYFSVEGSITGNMAGGASGGDTVAIAGDAFGNMYCPLYFTIVDRHVLGRGDDGDAWEDGSAAPAVIPEADGTYTMIYETVEDSRHLLGVATSEDGMTWERAGAVDFADTGDGPMASLEGVGSPAVIDESTGTRLLVFDGTRGGQQAIYGARGDQAADAAYTALAGGEALLSAGDEGRWDSAGVASPSVVEFGGETWLFYEGFGVVGSSIGAAILGADGSTFERVASAVDPDEPGLVLERGAAGEWDDYWIGSPQVRVTDDGTLEMVYAASDSDVLRIGVAFSEDGLTWTRYEDGDGERVPILGPDESGFDQEGCGEPWVAVVGDRTVMWYEGMRGSDPGVPRIGAAALRDGATWVKTYRPLQAGDGYVIDTEPGDTEEASSIDLGDDTSLVIDGTLIHGSGVADMALTPDGRYLLVTNKMYDNIYVIDVWDDSDEVTDDANYHGIEAVIQVPHRHAVTGTRGMAFSGDGSRMYLLLAPLVRVEDSSRRYGPEAVLVLDMTPVVDGDEPVIYDDLVIGYATTARGAEEDRGNPSVISGGATNIVLSPDESLAYVAHYNDNSVHVYLLGVGRDPVLIDVIEGLGDEPFDLVRSPDGRRLYVANYVGELEGESQNVVHSTLTVIDIDPASPTYHQVLTTLRNRDAW